MARQNRLRSPPTPVVLRIQNSSCFGLDGRKLTLSRSIASTFTAAEGLEPPIPRNERGEHVRNQRHRSDWPMHAAIYLGISSGRSIYRMSEGNTGKASAQAIFERGSGAVQNGKTCLAIPSTELDQFGASNANGLPRITSQEPTETRRDWPPRSKKSCSAMFMCLLPRPLPRVSRTTPHERCRAAARRQPCCP
jgi:hypothetical protein